MLDEAVSALDVSVRAKVLDLLVTLQEQEGIAYLFVSHDLGVVKKIADRVAVLDHGRIVESATADDLIRNPQSDAAKALVAATPRLKYSPEHEV